MSKRCTFTLDPERWSTETGRRCPLSADELTDGVWVCPRRATHGDRCVYHASDADPGRERLERDLAGRPDPDDIVSESGVHPARAAKRLVGARLRDVDLAHRRLGRDDTYPIDLRCATLGTVDATGAAVRVPVSLAGAALTELRLPDATFDRELDLRHAAVEESIHAKRGTFRERVRIKHAVVDGSVTFTDATCEGDLEVSESAVGAVSVLSARVDGDLSLRNAVAASGVTLRRTAVGGDLRLGETACSGTVAIAHLSASNVRADGVTIDDGGAFRAPQVTVGGDASLRRTTVDGDVVFRGADIGGDLKIDGVDKRFGSADGLRVDGDLVLVDATVAGELSAGSTGNRPLTVGGRLSAARLEAPTARLAPRLRHRAARAVDLSDARIGGGSLARPPDADRIWFDCTGATIGDVSVGGGRNALDCVRFVETTFRSFQFSRYRAAFSRQGWRPWAVSEAGGAAVASTACLPLARRLVEDFSGRGGDGNAEPDGGDRTAYDGDPDAGSNAGRRPDPQVVRDALDAAAYDGEADPAAVAEALSSPRGEAVDEVLDLLTGASDATPTPDEREATLLMAKNGADRVGDNRSASEFFIREKRATRDRHAVRADEADGLVDRVRARYDWGSNLLFSVAAGYGERPRRTVVLSALVIALFSVVYAATIQSPPYGRAVGYVILSLESFVTLVLGGAASIADPRIRLLAQIQGFVGAFLIALFVVTLTRSIDR